MECNTPVGGYTLLPSASCAMFLFSPVRIYDTMLSENSSGAPWSVNGNNGETPTLQIPYICPECSIAIVVWSSAQRAPIYDGLIIKRHKGHMSQHQPDDCDWLKPGFHVRLMQFHRADSQCFRSRFIERDFKKLMSPIPWDLMSLRLINISVTDIFSGLPMMSAMFSSRYGGSVASQNWRLCIWYDFFSKTVCNVYVWWVGTAEYQFWF